MKRTHAFSFTAKGLWTVRSFASLFLNLSHSRGRLKNVIDQSQKEFLPKIPELIRNLRR